MKKPTQTILILLLLAGGLAGFGQNRKGKNKLPLEEIIRLRTELHNEIENQNYEHAKHIKEILINNQDTEGEYLSYREYCILLMLTGEFDALLNSQGSGRELTTLDCGIESIEDELKTNLKENENEVLLLINQYPKPKERPGLRNTLQKLIYDKSLPRESWLNIYSGTQHRINTIAPINNSSMYSSSKTKNKKMDNYQSIDASIGCGAVYKYAFVTGKLGDYYSNIRLFDFSFHIIGGHFSFNCGMALFGAMGPTEIKEFTYPDQVVEGDIFGKSMGVEFSIGYEVIRKENIILTPTINLWTLNYELYPVKTKVFQQPYQSNPINYEIYKTAAIGPGITFDVKLLDLFHTNIWNTYAAKLRLQYSFPITFVDTHFNEPGIVNQFGVGLIFYWETEKYQ